MREYNWRLHEQSSGKREELPQGCAKKPMQQQTSEYEFDKRVQCREHFRPTTEATELRVRGDWQELRAVSSDRAAAVEHRYQSTAEYSRWWWWWWWWWRGREGRWGRHGSHKRLPRCWMVSWRSFSEWRSLDESHIAYITECRQRSHS